MKKIRYTTTYDGLAAIFVILICSSIFFGFIYYTSLFTQIEIGYLLDVLFHSTAQLPLFFAFILNILFGYTLILVDFVIAILRVFGF